MQPLKCYYKNWYFDHLESTLMAQLWLMDTKNDTASHGMIKIVFKHVKRTSNCLFSAVGNATCRQCFRLKWSVKQILEQQTQQPKKEHPPSFHGKAVIEEWQVSSFKQPLMLRYPHVFLHIRRRMTDFFSISLIQPSRVICFMARLLLPF